MFNINFTIDELKFTKIKLCKNSKIPLKDCSWSKKENWTKNQIDLNKYNYGILCGKINNLIVVDLDLEKEKKDNRFVPSGFEKIKEYIDEFGNLDTLTVKTPSGGIHYYFQYESKNKATNILIEQLSNASEFYNCGIDIRTEKKTGGPGGYIVGFESQINGNKYTIINNKPISEMPEDLAFWLLQGSPTNINNNIIDTTDKEKIKKNKTRKNITKNVIFNPKYKYDTTIEYVEQILNELPIDWTENRFNWLKVLTCLKNLNINGVEELFYKFSAKSTLKKHEGKLVQQKNKEEWDKNNCHIDFNYIICVVNKLKKTNYQLIQKYIPVINNVKFENNYVFENKYVEYDYKLFEEYDNIIIQSTPGTGKTTDTANKFLEYIKKNNNDKKIISIVGLTNTANQHISSFGKDDVKIKLNDYRNCGYSDINDNLVICINSLLKLDFLNIKQMKDKIIYIDEFEHFSNNLTHNKNLDNNIRLINNLLMKLVKNCFKLIISDALINDNVKNFLNISKSTRKTIFIKNTYKKFKGVKAVRYHNENDFLNQVKKDIEENNYFLFGSDSCSKITQYFDEVSKKDINEKQKIIDRDDEIITEIFNKLIADVDEEKKKKFLLITSKTAFKITNADEQFKDMFVFYSPSIVNSVDFNPKIAQNQYLYFNSMTINSQSMFQQGTRTRYIKELKFFGIQRQYDYIYEDINDVETINKDLINSCDKIKKVCLNTNEEDEETIIENAFFKMWCFNEYTNDCYNTNKICHFQNILINEGFILTHVGNDVVLDKKKQTQMIKTTQENNINNYDNFVELYKSGNKIEGYEKYIERINILNLKPDELDIDKFGYLVYNEYNLNSYFNLLKLFKTDEYINSKIDDLNISSYSVKMINNVYNKIYLLRKFESLFNIQPFDFDFKLDENDISKLTDSEFIKYKKIFRSEKKKPTKLNDFKIFYKQMIENITGNNLNIIIQKRFVINGKKIRKYDIDENKIQQFYFLSMRNCDKFNDDYNFELLKIFNINKPNDYKKYCFGINNKY